MAILWTCLMAGAALAAAAELFLLNRQRRLWLSSDRRVVPSFGRTPLARASHAPLTEEPGPARRHTPGEAQSSRSPAGPADRSDASGPAVDQRTAGSTPEDTGTVANLSGPRKLKCHAARRVLTQLGDGPAKPAPVRHHAARSVLHWLSFEEPVPPNGAASQSEAVRATAPAAEPEVRDSATAAAGAALPTEEGVVYVDSAGRLTFANPAARALLRWSGGELTLSEILAGGSQESAALLYAVARQELVGQRVTLRTGTSAEPIEISGLPFRDRDGNVWGAALFLRRAPTGAAVPTDTP